MAVKKTIKKANKKISTTKTIKTKSENTNSKNLIDKLQLKLKKSEEKIIELNEKYKKILKNNLEYIKYLKAPEKIKKENIAWSDLTKERCSEIVNELVNTKLKNETNSILNSNKSM